MISMTLHRERWACFPPIRHEAKTCKAEDHHGPCGGFGYGGNGSDDLIACFRLKRVSRYVKYNPWSGAAARSVRLEA